MLSQQRGLLPGIEKFLVKYFHQIRNLTASLSTLLAPTLSLISQAFYNLFLGDVEERTLYLSVESLELS